MAALWREAGLSWKDFLPEGEDVHTFLLEQVRYLVLGGPCVGPGPEGLANLKRLPIFLSCTAAEVGLYTD